jgi:hypothetical protein
MSTHDQHAGHDPEMFRRRFWWSLPLTIPLVAMSEMVRRRRAGLGGRHAVTRRRGRPGDTVSTIVVALDAQLLRRVHLVPPGAGTPYPHQVSS